MMTDDEFAKWASSLGMSRDTIDQITLSAAAIAEMFEAYGEEEINSPRPVYGLKDIKEMTESDFYGFWPLEYRLVLIGSCPNGDPIAVDIADDMGSVWYLDHETMYEKPPRSAAVRVADDVAGLVNGIASEDDFPIDHRAAMKRQR